jgi:hypothetical protein
LAPTVGTLGVGVMNSMAFLLLANNNSEVDKSQEMELTIGIELLHRIFGFNSPFGSDEIGFIGKQN